MLKTVMRTGSVHAATLIGWPSLLFLLVQLDALHPVFRLNTAAANLAFGSASFLFPFVSASYALNTPKHLFTRIILIIFLSPLLCLAIAALFFESGAAVETFQTGKNPNFELLARAPMDGYSVAVYRTDCGAPCSFGIYLLQEKPIFPGVLLVRALDSFDSADEANFQKLGENRLRTNVRKYSNSHTAIEAHDFELKSWVYF